KLKSIVFPRNQVNQNYLSICSKYGIKTYRGTEKIWFNRADSELNTTLVKRIFRTLDCYINISGHHTFTKSELGENYPYNIRSSRFLRPYNNRFPILEFLKLRRIISSMTHAAKNGEAFHLWWHPHNFGYNMDKNFEGLQKILNHYVYLNKKYGFESVTMEAFADEVDLHRLN
ncbi:MAG: polysaccharide deacetylase, partial [Allomuricauda sp.]